MKIKVIKEQGDIKDLVRQIKQSDPGLSPEGISRQKERLIRGLGFQLKRRGLPEIRLSYESPDSKTLLVTFVPPKRFHNKDCTNRTGTTQDSTAKLAQQRWHEQTLHKQKYRKQRYHKKMTERQFGIQTQVSRRPILADERETRFHLELFPNRYPPHPKFQEYRKQNQSFHDDL